MNTRFISNARLSAIDFITDCIGVRGTPENDERLRAAIASGCLDWRMVIDVAYAQKVTPALWVALRNRKLVENLPTRIQEYLWKVHLLNTLKNKRFKEQALEVANRLNSIGIEPMLLKGGASLFVSVFDDPGTRIMSDLDILVPPSQAKRCWDNLRALGYLPLDYDFDFSRHHHLRPLYRPGGYGMIEIHREPLLGETAAILPAELIWKRSEPIRESGVRMVAPEPTFRILHNLLHAALVNRAYARGDIALRSLHELALTQAVYERNIDWGCIRQLMSRGGKQGVLNAWLYRAHRWFGSSLPEGMTPTPGVVIHYARTRLQARWNWTQQVTDRFLWFSTPDICQRYQCDEDFVSLMTARAQLATHLSRKYSGRAFHWVSDKVGGFKA
jgi:hypothetical protein